MSTGFVRELIHLRRKYSDWLLTLLTILLLLMMFVIMPLQAAGMSIFQGFGVGCIACGHCRCNGHFH